jgi:hypothetical protein
LGVLALIVWLVVRRRSEVMAEDARKRRERESSPHALDFADAPLWVTPGSLRPGEIEALADKFAERPFEEMLQDRDFIRLSEEDLSALAAEFRRRASLARAETEGDDPREGRRATQRGRNL